MPLARTTLFAADFSERSRQAFRLASSLADETKTRIFVLHVVNRSDVVIQPGGLGDFGMPVGALGQGREDHETLLARLRAFYAPHRAIDVSYAVRDGQAADEILDMADETGADLIVMGTHGRTGLERLLTGSVAETVLRGARCPVLALRSAEQGQDAVGPQVILHPTDFSEPATAALAVARALARDLGARLFILHAAPAEVRAAMLVPIPPELTDYRENLAATRLRTDGPDLKFPVETRISHGYPAEEILRVANEIGCGLIVIGSHGRSGLGRMLMGSVAEAVLRKAGSPVLIVKTPDEFSGDSNKYSAAKGVTVY
jgi:nucleotide-binding universal stress UspA family protein